ncbi:MAG: hypothetical protein ACXVBW_10185, partial [Bdellovibrionota bacterium]
MNMKMISMVMMVFGFSGLAARASQDEGGLAKVVTVSPDRAFVPAGFDDNDNVEFVVTGKLPSTCFNIGPSETSVDPRSHRITLEQKAIYSSSCWCKQVI